MERGPRLARGAARRGGRDRRSGADALGQPGGGDARWLAERRRGGWFVVGRVVATTLTIGQIGGPVATDRHEGGVAGADLLLRDRRAHRVLRSHGPRAAVGAQRPRRRLRAAGGRGPAQRTARGRDRADRHGIEARDGSARAAWTRPPSPSPSGRGVRGTSVWVASATTRPRQPGRSEVLEDQRQHVETFFE